MSTKITKGNAGIVIDTDLQEFYTGFLDKVAPNAKQIIDSSLEEIQRGAVRDWPVRPPEIREKDGKIVFFRIATQESWKKFERGYRITPDGGFEGYLRNTAPYSWAIKFGVDSKNNQGRDIIQPQNRRVATELMVKPQKKQSKKVISALADDLMRRI
jgi:hypothetical protein